MIKTAPVKEKTDNGDVTGMIHLIETGDPLELAICGAGPALTPVSTGTSIDCVVCFELARGGTIVYD